MVVNENLNFFDRVFLRTPLYSPAVYALDQLPVVLGQEVFRYALWLASPEFYDGLEKKGFVWGDLDEKQRFTLCKYYNRMCFRPTPFGAFAAFTVAGWSADRLSLAGLGEMLLHTWPSLERQQDVRAWQEERDPDPMLFLNPTVYRLGRNWRYTRASLEASGKFSFALAALACGSVNDRLLRMLAKRPLRRSALAALLEELAGCGPDEALDYLCFLVQEEVLYTAHRLSLIQSGEVPGAGMISCRLLDFAGHLARNPAGGEDMEETGQSFYVASERPLLGGGLDPALREQSAAVIALLRRLVPATVLPDLAAFREAFKARFEGQKVPLLLALDPDTGINYGGLSGEPPAGGLLDGLDFPVAAKSNTGGSWSGAQRLLLAVWLRNSTRGAFEPVVIRDEDLDVLDPADTLPLPPTLPLLFSRAGGQLLLESAGGAGAAALLGRFSLFSNEVQCLCREIAAAEAAANPAVVFAELHQLSHLKVDNVSRRMPVYDHVIPLNTVPGGAERHLLPADLVLSVSGNEVWLESVALGKRVIPRLPTAYNYRHNDNAVFRLLCDLQFQGIRADLGFDPERFFPGLGYYPRVVYGEVILSLAKWKVSGPDAARLCHKPYSIGALHLYRQERGIPRFISAGRDDQQLNFDLGRDEEALFFLETLAGRPSVLKEFIAPGDGMLSDRKQKLAAQALVLWKNREQVYTGVPVPAVAARGPVRRSFPPGSEWLYVKVYCTARASAPVLLEVLRPFLVRHRALIRGWFFIRYMDPDPHLRIRLLVGEKAAKTIVPELNRVLGHRDREEWVRAYRYDTYHRELERYSPGLICQVEEFFGLCSDWVLDYLSAGNGDAEVTRLEPLVLVYRWCVVFMVGTEERAAFLDRMRSHYLDEFNAGRQLPVALDRKYRVVSRDLRAALEAAAVGPDKVLAGALERVRLAAGPWPEGRRQQLLADLVHMQVNRIYETDQRRHEGVIYYFLHKYEVSAQARA